MGKKLNRRRAFRARGRFWLFAPNGLAARIIMASVVVWALAFLQGGCSIFDMESPEPPLVGTVTEDPLGIGDVLSIARGSAVNMDYRDYFADNVRFEYPLISVNGKNDVINMLNRLRSRASLVEWQIDRADIRIVEHNRQIVENVPYVVYSGGAAICAGMADFHIIRELDWVISYWKDVPDGGYAPFFEP